VTVFVAVLFKTSVLWVAMALKDTGIKNLKFTDKAYRSSDSGGLFVWVTSAVVPFMLESISGFSTADTQLFFTLSLIDGCNMPSYISVSKRPTVPFAQLHLVG
jgi:hypothetical protein